MERLLKAKTERSVCWRDLLIAGTSAVALLAGGAAFAQEAEEPAPQAEEEEEEKAQSRDRIVVTGSLIRRDEFTSASPIQVITSETASLEGLLDTSEILQESSIAAGSTQINTQFGGFIVNGGPGVNSVSLRGLGAQRTLILFNGRRYGPSGVEGRVGAVDLNTIPQSVVQRIEILKDGAGSIYGSDAVAGVINVITDTQIDKPVLNVTASLPFEGGGESFRIDGAYGLNFDKGYLSMAAAYNRSERLVRGDRDYFTCPEDYVFSEDRSTRVDRIERNPTTDGQGEFKCFNSGVVNAIDVFNNTTRRFIMDPAAVNTQLAGNYYPGFRLRGTSGTGTQLGIEETNTNDPRLLEEDILPEVTRTSLFLSGEYDLGFGTAYGEFLYNNRQTEQSRNRQLFPWSTASRNAFANPAALPANCFNGATYTASCGGTPAFTRPIALIPFGTSVDIDYFYGVGGLRGSFGENFGPLSDWSWDMNLSHSRSDGSYTRDTVDVRNVVDALDARSTLSYVRNPGTGAIECAGYTGDDATCVPIDYFSQDFLLGNWTDAERNFLIKQDTGATVFTQTTFNAIATGDVFELPAGALAAAVGVEFRKSEIDDQPGTLSFNNQQWGLTSAVNTQGQDEVYEAFAELDIPVLSGVPFAESLSLQASGRVFDYELYDTDSVYKLGFNWQINPLVRLRGTKGTSFRAPGLFELYLGNQTGFAGQGSIDPCIDWGESTNPFIRANCAAAGVPDDYAGIGSSATVISGGGAGFLSPETSEAETLGVIFTPTAIDLSLALDYFEITVDNQVAQLGAGSILGGCYGGSVFPNSFCDLFVRDTNPASPSFNNILTVNNNFVNINEQRTRGLDITARYEHEFDFGDLTFDMSGTWTFEDAVDLFQGVEGFATNDFNGSLGDPDFVANSNIQFRRGDFTYSWFTDFVSRMSNDELFEGNIFTFNGAPSYFKQYSEAYFQHGASVRYRGEDWVATFGVTNIFDEHPAAVSTGTDNRLGVTSLSATQFDLRGRSGFLSVTKEF